MKQKYVILIDPSIGGSHRSVCEDPGEIESIRVEVAGLDKKEADRLAREPGYVLAPAMPMKLIEPVDAVDEDAKDPVHGDVAWGVESVGAARTAFSGQGVVVAILDTGIDLAHPAFAHLAGRIVRENFTDEADDDTDGHGTHCAGTVFGRSVNDIRIGVAPGIEKALIGKVLGRGGGSSDSIAEAIQWAIRGGAHIISMSLGIDFPGCVKKLEQRGIPSPHAISMVLEDYRENLRLFETLASYVGARGGAGKDALLVAATGNESRRNGVPAYEIAAGPPATAEGFVSVGALGKSPAGLLRVAPFSNTGADVTGPGVGILSAGLNGTLVEKSGTSMATPHVAGVAALWAEKLLAQGPLRTSRLREVLFQSAAVDQMEPGSTEARVGRGIAMAPP